MSEPEDKLSKLQETLNQMRNEVSRLFPDISPDTRKAKVTAIRGIHHGAIHAIRKFATEGHFAVVLGSGKPEKPYEPYENLANSCNNALAAVTGGNPADIHCTLKYFTGKDQEPAEDREVWTFARSTIQSLARPKDIGPGYFQKIGENSGFAALVGCKDTKNNWTSPPHRCFACRNLPNYDEYVNSKLGWERWYTSTLVFPLRYEKWSEKVSRPHDYVMGFLTFDSLDNSIFGDIPSIFDYIDRPGEYARELDKFEVCHAGGIIADTFAMVMMLERRLQSRLKTNAKE